ncbi:HAD-IA family hydrolase [uncultured Arcticibacterium sp.]|uniref:HAD-IA family hydrolase n=1 Tax=uncultured Arcticibacterium sp. TaxID=2173042 RepID=UPI0030F79907
MIPKMHQGLKGFIFDMDGIIIDSEPLWKKAEKEVFSSLGVQLTEELCLITERMTTSEVTKFWFEKFPWEGKTLKSTENSVVNRVSELIKKEGKAIKDVKDFIKRIKLAGFKIGLATNSPAILIPVVLEKLELSNYFDVIASSEFELVGKPNPSVYKTALRKLNLDAKECIAIEDSNSGLMAAKRAGLKTVALSSENKKSEYADHQIHHYNEFDFSIVN